MNNFVWNRKKYNLLDTELKSPFGGETRYFTTVNYCFGHTLTIKLIKIKLIQSLLNPTNALWKDLMLHWLKLIWILIRPRPFSTKTDFYRSTSHKILHKKSNEDFLYSITLFLATPHQQQFPSLIHTYRRNSCPTHIFNTTHQPGF